ncbi:hypothetical protein CTheo_8979 [Ceratobasidium theobromae]|uniref:RNase H type-1 domain-containing protein n=1 Tax=Ceratobasidium theobromae TaxID=1582974 RepID=A0A5N5Q701_9AGAM|nr:hypothetical protein CTheo_8979 [Ceratobasidium theobromae]
MFNSVEFALMLLSMFISVTKQNRSAVMFLFEVALSYDKSTGEFRKTNGVLESVRRMFEPLRALGVFHGVTYEMENIKTTSVGVITCGWPGASGVLTWMGRVIGCTGDVKSPERQTDELVQEAEVEAIRKSLAEGLELLEFTPVGRIQEMVNEWTRKAKTDGRFEDWFGRGQGERSKARVSTNGSPIECSGGESSDAKLDSLVERVEGGKSGDERKAHGSEYSAQLSNIQWDGAKLAGILGLYSSGQYAAAPMKCGLRRWGRVDKQYVYRAPSHLVGRYGLAKPSMITTATAPVSLTRVEPKCVGNTEHPSGELYSGVDEAEDIDLESEYESMASTDSLISSGDVEGSTVGSRSRVGSFKFPAGDGSRPVTPELEHGLNGTTPSVSPLLTPKMLAVDLFDGWASAWETEQLCMWWSCLETKAVEGSTEALGSGRGGAEGEFGVWADGWEREQFGQWERSLRRGSGGWKCW